MVAHAPLPPPGLATSPEALRGELRPRDVCGLARLDLSGMLAGQRLMEFTVPVTNCPYLAPGGEGLPRGGERGWGYHMVEVGGRAGRR